MATIEAETSPADRSAISWSTRRAALASRGVPDADPRVRECLSALVFWRCRKALDADRGRLTAEHADELAAYVREAVTA